MKLAITGSTGFLGQVLLRKALAASHTVRALVRTPAKLGPLAGQVDVVHGDMFDPAALQALIRDVDAVISVAGPPFQGPHDPAQYGMITGAWCRAVPRAARHPPAHPPGG